MLRFLRLSFCTALIALGAGHQAWAREAYLRFESESPPARFAADEIEAALRARRYEVTRGSHVRPADESHIVSVVIDISTRPRADTAFSRETALRRDVPLGWRAEGFSIRQERSGGVRRIYVDGADAAGAMYGGLELAEQIRTRGVDGIANAERSPYMSLRGTKFNLPLDLRTPSYSDMSDSAQQNIATVWDFDFWREYLDQLARHRYNAVTLWNLHPFPSMVKVPEYPDVALNDVWRSRIEFDEDYSTRTVGIVTPAMLAKHEVVKQLTIEQKIDFWRRVMQHARDRNIDVYVVTWNIFTYGVDGRYGIDDSLDNPKTRDYFRASVRELFRTYPQLRGIGLTVGENMGEISGDTAFQRKEDWAFATYGQGVLDAARAEPQRQIRLIHRQHEASASDIAARFAPVIAQPNVDFVFSFKYAQAHVLSATTQTFHREFIQSLGELKTLWTLRNDDALMYRWAAPDFVREFVTNIPHGKSAGYYYGSDMWVWGREFLSKTPASPRQLEVDKHWLAFLLWGRLGYDPTLDNTRIAALVGGRFPGADGTKLLAAWQDASLIYPLVTGFHWADFDFQWYIEACRSRPAPARTASGFHSVETFITQKVHPGTDNVPIPAYVAAVAKGERIPGTTPLEAAKRIDARAGAALAALPALEGRAAAGNPELAATLGDIRRMALLGKYYAAKIRGATELALFRETKRPGHQRDAIAQLERAAAFWAQYITSARQAYKNPLWTNRVGIVDWEELNRDVRNDVEIARASVP
jgi:hypothetical protein